MIVGTLIALLLKSLQVHEKAVDKACPSDRIVGRANGSSSGSEGLMVAFNDCWPGNSCTLWHGTGPFYRRLPDFSRHF